MQNKNFNNKMGMLDSNIPYILIFDGVRKWQIKEIIMRYLE